MEIKVLGTGCAKCDKLEEVAKKAIKETGVDAELEKVTDIQEITKAGAMMTPALLVNDNIKVAGKIPSIEELVKIIKDEEG